VRPKGSAQFEGDLDKALKEFVRNANDRRETLARMSRDCVAKRHHLGDVEDGIEVEA